MTSQLLQFPRRSQRFARTGILVETVVLELTLLLVVLPIGITIRLLAL
jgi:hypothetical protein